MIPGISALPLKRSIAGSASYALPGNYVFTVPIYTTLTVEVNGPGAGGGGSFQYTYGMPGSAGSQGFEGGGYAESWIATPYGVVPSPYIEAFSGNGGQGAQTVNGTGSDGAGGTATNGDSNVTGGGATGGAGGGCTHAPYHSVGGHGGAGGKATKTWSYGAAGAPTVGQQFSVVVAAGGGGGQAFSGWGGVAGQNGNVGAVNFTWA